MHAVWLGMRLRLILAWGGQALVYSAAVILVLLTVRFFGQLARRAARDDRRPEPVTGFQGSISLTAAMFCLGSGMALLSLSVAALMPLAFGSILLAVVIALYGVRLIRTRS